MNNRFIHLILCLLFCATNTFGQNYLMDGSPITDCGGFFIDSGGGSSNYGPNENFTTTICSDGIGGTHISLLFSPVFLGAGDALCFFDGTDTSTPLSCAADFDAGSPFIIQATAVNVSGCLTITFTSDGTGEGQGWSAAISCVAACQTINAVMASTNPAVFPIDTGWIDICPGDGVQFVGTGFYPQDGIIYNHSDLTSNFSWNFGDGDVSVGPTAYHIFDNPGGYIVELTIEDQFGCKNTNFLSQRIRVSTPPNFNLNGDLPDQICAIDTICMSAQVNVLDSLYEVSVEPVTGTFQTGGIVSDSLPLPDGTGASYSTSINFTTFSPGQVLTNINDLLGVCVSMEHSWMFDLDIFLACPDGTQITLQSQEFILNEVFLGEPYEADDGNTPNPPGQGSGYDYCWTPGATTTWTEYANMFDPQTLPEGDYAPFESMDNLLGCPMNGEWTITVIDQWGSDNGWIFQWSIDFAAELYPSIETFTPNFVDWEWLDNPTIVSETMDSICAVPQNAGTASYTFEVSDDFGCVYDTTVNVQVLPFSHPDCYDCGENASPLSDSTICDGETINLNASGLSSLSSQEIIFEAFPNAPIENDITPPGNPFASVIEVTNISPATLTDPENEILSVCVNIDHSYDSDVEIYLQGPNGTLVELSTDNGSFNDNYENTCFSPSAPQSITDGAPPFTGVYQPEGDWSTLVGEPTNGQWTLLVGDDSNGFTGTFLNWSITFSNQVSLTYDWTPSPDLSCLDCPDPSVSPSMTTDYFVSAIDDYNCEFTDTVTVTVLDAFAAPMITCGTSGIGEVTFEWDPIPGATSYEVSLDGGVTWITPTGPLSHLVTGVPVGGTVNILIRVDAGTQSGCAALEGVGSCISSNCISSLDTSFVMNPSCYNTTDGSVLVSAQNALPPVDYFLDGGAAQTSNAFSNLGGGFHSIIAIDADGCVDSISFTLVTPDTINLDFVIDPVSCFGGANGEATVTASGGNNNFTYTWLTTPTTGGQTLSGLSVGSYIVSVTDQVGANNCIVLDTIDILEPTQLIAIYEQDSVSCFGFNDGSASATPSGGTPFADGSYTYLWSDGQTDSLAIDLTAGTYSVTVTDANNCSTESMIEVLEPDGMTLVIDNVSDVTCYGTSTGSIDVTVTGGVMPYDFVWTDGQMTEDASGLPADTYGVVVTDASGCTVGNAMLDVTQPDSISITSLTTDVSCQGVPNGAIDLTVMGGTPLGTGAYTIMWSNGSTTEDITNLDAGGYAVTITDANACVFIPDTIFIANADPITVTAVEIPTSCFGGADGGLDITVMGGNPMYTYAWPGGITTEDIGGLAPGSYTVTVMDATLCSAMGTFMVPEPTLLTLNTSSQDVNCFGGTDGLANVFPIGGTEPYTYEWNDGFLGPGNTNLPAGDYTITVMDDNDCMASGMVSIMEPATAVTVTTDQTFMGCFDANNSEATATAAGGVGPYDFEWSNGDNTAIATALGATIHFVTITDDNDCIVLDTIEIAQFEEILGNLIHVEPSCNGTSDGQLGINIIEGGAGMNDLANYNYQWNTTPLQTGLTVMGLAGDQSYTVTITDGQGCTGTESFLLQQPSPILLTIGSTDATCFGNADGTAEVISATGDQTVFTYQWDANAGGQTTAAAIDLGAGSYNVTVTDAASCTVDTFMIIEQPELIDIDFTVGNNPCGGDQLGSIVVDVTGGTPDYIYDWSDSGDSGLRDSLTTGLYYLTITDNNNCMRIDSAFVGEPEPIVVDIEPFDVTCFGDNDGQLLLTTSGGTGPYLYSTDGEFFNGSSTQIGLSAGTYDLYIQDANDCITMETASVGEPSEFMVDAGDDVTIFLGDSTRLHPETIDAVGMTNLTWVAPYEGTLNCIETDTDCSDPWSVSLSTITYTLIGVDENGCEASDEVTIIIDKTRNIQVPTGFSPNGDNVNDILQVHGIGRVVKKITTFRVYDRWGELLYEEGNFSVNNPDIGWDGTFRGKEVNSGTYVWYAEVEFIDGFVEIVKGNVTLIR